MGILKNLIGTSKNSFQIGNKNKVYESINYLQTINATPVNLLQIPVSQGDTVFVETNIVAQHINPAAGRAIYKLLGCFYRIAGKNVTQQGLTIASEIESINAWDADLIANTSNQSIDIRVRGAGTINWKSDTKWFTVKT